MGNGGKTPPTVELPAEAEVGNGGDPPRGDRPDPPLSTAEILLRHPDLFGACPPALPHPPADFGAFVVLASLRLAMFRRLEKVKRGVRYEPEPHVELVASFALHAFQASSRPELRVALLKARYP